MRRGQSPSYPRGMITPPPCTSVVYVQRNRRGHEYAQALERPTQSSTHTQPTPEGTLNQATAGMHSSLQEAMTEVGPLSYFLDLVKYVDGFELQNVNNYWFVVEFQLRAAVKKIRNLSRSMDDPRRPPTTYSTRIEEKLEELLGLLSKELSGGHPGGSGGSGGAVTASSSQARRGEGKDTAGREAEKRKRSRQIITLKRTYETMDVDVNMDQ